jgi:hypothetical protein
LGALFMEIYDKPGGQLITGKTYKIIGESPDGNQFSGTLDGKGRLRHTQVPPDDYVLSVEGRTETSVALVLPAADPAPQIRFLS